MSTSWVPGAIKIVCFLSNSAGELEWKQVSLAPSTAIEATQKTPDKFDTAEEAGATALAKYEAYWMAEKTRMGIPDPDKIYSPKAALSGPHPRYLFADMSLTQLKQRMNAPALAPYKSDLYKLADRYSSAPPPDKPNMNNEDPLRDYGDRLPWIALAYLATDDAAKKKTYLDSAVAYVNAYTSWGLPTHDLPLSQMMLGMGATYDWLYSDLPAGAKAKARQYLVDGARFMRSPSNASAWQWRSGGNWLANHKWFNYSALALASAVLWGDAETPLKPGEQKLWIDEAMQVFWAVRKTFGPDGAPVEGYTYQEYGLRPYLDFASLADQLTNSTVSFADTPGIRNIGVSRLHSLLPGGAGFFTYADSYPRAWGSSLSFRYVASRFHDPNSQLLADVMDRFDGGEPVVLEAAKWTIAGTGTNGKAGPKVGALHGQALVSGDPAGTGVSTTFTISKAGWYTVLVKYAAGIDATRSLKIDDKLPFREAGYVPFASTGGWSTDKNEWRFVFLGEEVPGFSAPWKFYLTQGRHALALNNDAGGGLNLDWLAFVPADMTKDAVVAKLGDTDAHVVVAKDEATHNWHGLFWYDPSVPSAKWSDLSTYRDNDDLGLYTARSSWTAPNATWMGFKCGPVSGKEVLKTFGLLVSGHSAPDEGAVQFYYGPHAVLPAPGYAHPVRLTRDYSVTVVEGKGKNNQGQLVGQIGEGGEWFSNNWKSIRSNPTTLFTDHKPNYHTYLADMSGIYQATDGNNAAGRTANTVSSYRRSVTYLTNGALVIVDKIESPTPQTYHFRLLTEAKDMAQTGKEFDFTIARVPGRIVDFSPGENARLVTQEKVSDWANPGNDPTTRTVATIKSEGQAKAIFAAVLGMNGAEKGITVQATGAGIVINGAPGGPITLDWKPNLQPLPANPAR